MLNLDAYLVRIGLSGRPDIAQVHRAHLTSIPFENLDPHQGLPVSSRAGAFASSTTGPSSCSNGWRVPNGPIFTAFPPQPVPLIDVEMSIWWTSTHPHSRFVKGLIVGVRSETARGHCCATGAESCPSAS